MHVVLIGLGDLGQRIALQLTALGGLSKLVLVGSSQRRVQPFAALARSCTETPIHVADVDVLNQDSFAQFVQRERPDAIVQCASLLSPWVLQGRQDPTAERLRQAGFAYQLCAQLPIIAAVMAGVRSSDVRVPVVNCSYPDVTHAVLAHTGNAPTLGVGNVGMLAEALRAADPSRFAGTRFRLLAHHAHVNPALAGSKFKAAAAPRLYLGEQLLAWGREPRVAPEFPLDKDLNALSAAHAVWIIRALLGLTPRLLTHAPGPLGLEGGYPVVVERGKVSLDLPPGLDLAEAETLQHSFARLDGVERITEGGVVHFTEAFQGQVASLSRALAEPLYPDDALARFTVLSKLLGVDSTALVERQKAGR